MQNVRYRYYLIHNLVRYGDTETTLIKYILSYFLLIKLCQGVLQEVVGTIINFYLYNNMKYLYIIFNYMKHEYI